MNRRSYTIALQKTIPVALLLAFLIGITGVYPALAGFNGDLETDLVLSPNEPTVFDEDSSMDLRIDYVDGEVEDLPSMISQVLFWPNTTLVDTGLALRGSYDFPLFEGDDPELILDGYYASEFGPDYPIGTAGGSTRLSLEEDDLNYWATKGIVNYGGFSYRGTFVLEENARGDGEYGTGYELSVSGTKISGLEVTLTSRVGMVSSPGELIAGSAGSGYDVFDMTTGEKYDGYTGSEVEVEGLSVGDLNFDTTSTFDFKDGLKSVVFTFEADDFSPLVDVDGSITFTPDSKSVTLLPRIDLGWSCIDLYTALDPGTLTKEENSITGVRVYGFGVDELILGNVTVSGKIGLDSSSLYLRKSAQDYESRASDYTFSPSPQEKAYYDEKPYDGVISLERDVGNFFIAADGYWGEGTSHSGLELVTGEMEYKFSDQFEVSGGVNLRTETGLENIFVNTIYSW